MRRIIEFRIFVPGIMNRHNYRLAVNNDIKIKGVFSFRLGCTSFVFPDDILPNVVALAGHVDDIELLCFESDEISPLPSEEVVNSLEDIARKNNLTYTVHLPVDTDIGSLNEVARVSSVKKIIRVIDCFSKLVPVAYILHIPRPSVDVEQSANMDKWHTALSKSISEIDKAGVNLSLLAVETLDYPFQWLSSLFDRFTLSVCLDIGHLWLHNSSVNAVIDEYGKRIRVVHLHGIKKGKDHCAISVLDDKVLADLFLMFDTKLEKGIVVTLEVFGHNKLVDSIEKLFGVTDEKNNINNRRQ